MEEASTPADRGFTLIELVIAVGVIAMTAAVGIGISLASRSLAVTSAATEFDQFLDSARTMARDLDGATLAFEPDAYGDGTQVRLLALDANGTLVPTTLPPLHARAIIEETLSLGKPPFAFVVHANGALGGRPGFVVGGGSSTEVGCPPSGAFHFLVHTANASADRFVPCRIALANTGPVSLSSLQPEPTAPPPTPCSGVGCTTPSLPPPPSSTPTCPASFTPVQGGCIPTPTPTPNAGAHYHVTISGASPTLSAGATESFTAQATLTNAAGAAPGTPTSIPVFVATTTTGICTATPPGSQPSGSAFTITGLVAGTCTISMQADTSGVIGSSADTASITITISNAPAPTPTPQSCDLTQNGKCFHQIVPPTVAQFVKDVFANTVCSSTDGTCSYVDSIKQVTLTTGFSFVPSTPPQSADHELLFRVDKVLGLAYACAPFASFATLNAGDPLPTFGSSIGSPVDTAPGFGEPTIYVPQSYFVLGLTSAIDDTALSNLITPNVGTLVSAVASGQVGAENSIAFSSANAAPSQSLAWFPDFPGCDNFGAADVPDPQFGEVGIQLLFEVFQASPIQ